MNEENKNNLVENGINVMPKEAEKINPAPTEQTINNVVKNSNKEGVVGPIIGTLLIIVILILGGLYFWGYVQENKNPQNNTNLNQQQELNNENNASEKSEEEKIENELDSINVDEIENELKKIDAEIDSALN